MGRRYRPPAQPMVDKVSDPDEFVLRVPLADRAARAAITQAAMALSEIESMAAHRDSYRGDDVRVASGKPGSKEPGNRHAAGALRRACRQLLRIPPIASQLADALDDARDRMDGKMPALPDGDQPALPGRPSAQTQTVGGISREVHSMVEKAKRLGALPAGNE